MSTILITGGAGTLGRALTPVLLDRGETVRSLVLATTEPLPGASIEIIEADRREWELLRRATMPRESASLATTSTSTIDVARTDPWLVSRRLAGSPSTTSLGRTPRLAGRDQDRESTRGAGALRLLGKLPD